MTLPRLFAIAVLALCPGLTAHASGKKGEATTVSFHLQADETDNTKFIFPQDTAGRKVFYRRAPEVNLKDIAAFNPFPSQDGDGFGIMVQLKPHAKNRIAAITNGAVNRWMLAMVNGRKVDAVIVDKEINDGILVIWKGIGAAEIDALDQKIPRIGEEKPRKKK